MVETQDGGRFIGAIMNFDHFRMEPLYNVVPLRQASLKT
jgi:hypothetical protein